MATKLLTKALTNATLTSVMADNSPFNVEDRRGDCGILVDVTGASAGDVISVNLIGGLQADLMESVPMIGCPLTVTIASGQTSQLFTLNIRGIAFLQAKSMQTTNAGGCTVNVWLGGYGR